VCDLSRCTRVKVFPPHNIHDDVIYAGSYATTTVLRDNSRPLKASVLWSGKTLDANRFPIKMSGRHYLY